MESDQQFRTRPPIENELQQLNFKERHRRRMSLPVNNRADMEPSKLLSTITDSTITSTVLENKCAHETKTDKSTVLGAKKKESRQRYESTSSQSSCSSYTDTSSDEECDVSPRIRYQKCENPPDYCIRDVEDHEYGRNEIEYAQRGL